MPDAPAAATQSTAMNFALAGLFDYAGIFPPAEQELRAAVQDYLAYRHGRHAWAMGSLVISVRALRSLQDQFREKLSDLHLSITASSGEMEDFREHLDAGLTITMIEVKVADPDEIFDWQKILPAEIATYIEVPVSSCDSRMLGVISEAGMRAKLRMGGVVAEAFPAAISVAALLKMLAARRIPFKATAGLHHPLRSRHPFTYQKNSETGMMHGFINLLCASALVWFGGEPDIAVELLEEQDPQAWRITANAIQWRSWSWSAEQLRQVRKRFLISIGSCSFSEPMSDLERLGWL